MVAERGRAPRVIVTFYSYKGGVGRSMALANVAQWLYLQGARVVMIDWDLEAPGLENYFFQSPKDVEEVRARPGLIDLLASYKAEFQRASRSSQGRTSDKVFTAAIGSPAVRDLRRWLQEIWGPSPANGGSLSLLSAGARRPDVAQADVRTASQETPSRITHEDRQAIRAQLTTLAGAERRRVAPTEPGEPITLAAFDEQVRLAREVAAAEADSPDSGAATFSDYVHTVQEFDWAEFFTRFEGEAFVGWMRDQLLGPPGPDQESFADVVLIDSRTGVTEMGGLCTRVLADVVVTFCASNDQNLDGATRMARSFRRPDILKRRAGKPEVLLVPSRIEDRAETEDRLRFQGDFEHREREFPTRVFRFQENALLRQSDPPRPASPAPKFTYWTLQIPYFGKLSYHEALTFPVDGSRGRVLPIPELQAVYAKLGAYLVAHAPVESSLRRRLASALQRELPDLAGPVALSYWPDGETPAREVQKALTRAGIRSSLHLDAGVDRPGTSSTIFIAPSRALLVLLTPLAMSSETLRRQIRFAREQGKALALVQAGPARLPWEGLGRVYAWPNESASLISDLAENRSVERAPNTAPTIAVPYVERRDLVQQVAADVQNAPKDSIHNVILCGQAGFGKTVLAQAVCHQGATYDAYPGGILWINMGEQPRLAAEFSRLYQAFTGETVSFQGEHEGRARLAERLRGRRVLWVVDDLCLSGDLERLPKPDCPLTRLITTRDLRVARDLGITPHRIGAMTLEESAAVLRSNRSLPDSQLSELARVAEQWPLLLALMRDAITRALARGEEPAEAITTVETILSRHGVVGFDPWVSDPQKLSTNLNTSLRRVGLHHEDRPREGGGPDVDLSSTAELSRFALPALARLGTQPATFKTWTPSQNGPTDEERDRLRQRLADLALIEIDAAGEFLRLPRAVSRFLETQGLRGEAQEPSRRRPVASATDRLENEDLESVLSVLRARKVTDPARKVKELVGRLKAARYFGYARQLLALARQNPALVKDLGVWLGQQQALCTYKDPDLPADARLDRALAILDRADPMETTASQETLGIAGAIHKAKWGLDGQRGHLEDSLAYYRRGYQQGVARDHGYTALNVAYVLDLLAGGGAHAAAEQRVSLRAEASRIREEIVVALRGLLEQPQNEWLRSQWWFLVTLAEACFGLGWDAKGHSVESRYEEARYWMREALVTDHSDWEYESTVRQLASLVRLQYGGVVPDDSSALRTLRVLLADDIALDSVQVGKVGLALSGGGFRASLFHIGVLAKLAELDLLRRVEVLSCVSGGSIVGAHYYLEVRRLMEAKADDEITRQDYVDIVERMVRDFLLGVQDDLRNRLLSETGTNLRSAFGGSDAQTRRLGELFERHLFARVPDGQGKRERFLSDLVVQPKGARTDFAPKLDNWRRRAKVPVLILNATTLNTGHNWQFTARWMGEPPASVNSDIDVNDRLPRMYYREAPPTHRRFRLGHAVAASAAVPMLFPPLRLDGLYEEHRAVQLTDGGVHDNQGVASLVEQDCAVLLVSDASGQLRTDRSPSSWRIGVGKRTNGVLQERIRGAEYRELQARKRSGLMQGLMFVHLTRGLEGSTIPWIGSEEPPEPPDDPSRPPPKTEEWQPTAYEVPRAWQRRMAKIRTDLDSFSDREGYALMWSGYQMTGHDISPCLLRLSAAGQPETWRFLQVKQEPSQSVEAALELGERQFGKVWRLSKPLRRLVWLVGLLAAIDLVWLWLALPSGVIPGLALGYSVRERALAAAILAAGACLAGAVVASGIGVAAWLRGQPAALWLLLAALGPPLKVYVRLVRPIYVELGAIEPITATRSWRRVTAGILTLASLVLGAACLYLWGNVPPW